MRPDKFYLGGGVNRVLSYYCLFYLGAVVRELQKTVRTEKYHYWKMVVAFLILVLCNQIGSIALDENRYENPAFLLVVSICGWVLLYEVAQELKKKKAAGGCNCLLWTKFDGDSCTAFPVL